MVKLKKVSVLPVAKILSAIHAVVGVLLGIAAAMGSMMGQQDEAFFSLGMWSILVFPILNSILGFLTGAFLAWAYNLFAQWFGGIEFELENG